MRIVAYQPDGTSLGYVDSREHVLVVLATDDEKCALIDCENEGLILFPASIETQQAFDIVTKKTSRETP